MNLQGASPGWGVTRQLLLEVLRRAGDAIALAAASLTGLTISLVLANDSHPGGALLSAHFGLWLVMLLAAYWIAPARGAVAWGRIASGAALAIAAGGAAALFVLATMSRRVPTPWEAASELMALESLLFTLLLAIPFLTLSRRSSANQIDREQPDREAARRNEEALSVIFHELRRPLTLLVASSEMALDPTTPEPERQQFVSSVHNQALRLAGYLEELLECSRIQASRLRITSRPLNMGSLVEDVVAEFRDSHVPRTFKITCNEGVFVSGDEARLRMVVRNLVGNAIKYSPEASTVRISVTGQGRAQITVEDDGPGIPEAYHREIFEQFFRVPGSAATGFGLGLYVSRQLVKAHRGTIAVENLPGRGVRFTVSLPTLPRSTEIQLLERGREVRIHSREPEPKKART